ncbi:hypothetical protein BGC39_02005 [Levilactobacillus brevis]|nr:hypothetical protein BGC39_02005 [Levilactobacillus brevis]
MATSMAQFRKNLLKAQPSKDGKSHYGNYVTLEDLTAAVDGALPESLGYTQEATSDPNGVSITTMLFDASASILFTIHLACQYSVKTRRHSVLLKLMHDDIVYQQHSAYPLLKMTMDNRPLRQLLINHKMALKNQQIGLQLIR